MWHVRKRKMPTGFWWEILKKRDHLEHLGLDRRIILKWLLRKQGGGHLYQDRKKLTGFVQTVLNFPVPVLGKIRNAQILKKVCATWR